MSGGAAAITGLWDVGVQLLVCIPNTVSDAFNAMEDMPEYTRRLQFTLPLEMDGQEYSTKEAATEAFKLKITDKMGVQFEGDVSTDAKIVLQGQTSYVKNALTDFNEATSGVEIPDSVFEIHFRDGKTLNDFVDSMDIGLHSGGMDFDHASIEGQRVSVEGQGDWTLFGPMSGASR